MFFHLTTRIISSVSAFLYPGYASYKVLSQRPASEEELERWLMYWSVLGCIIGIEYLAEWLISWIPFYYTFKALFLLYLALPQTRGASYIYITYLHPFFHMHEQQIDATLASLKARAYEILQERLRALWDTATSITGASMGSQPSQTGPPPPPGPAGSAPPPRLTDPVSGPAQLVSSFWRSYGPSIVASGAAILRSATAAASSQSAPGTGTSRSTTLNTPPPSIFRSSSSTQSVLERRRELEAELAALRDVRDDAPTMLVPETLIPGANNQPGSRSSSSLGMRERTSSGTGRFEEIEVPSDADDDGQGHAMPRPGAPTRAGGSWFGWGSGGKGGGYERVKDD